MVLYTCFTFNFLICFSGFYVFLYVYMGMYMSNLFLNNWYKISESFLIFLYTEYYMNLEFNLIWKLNRVTLVNHWLSLIIFFLFSLTTKIFLLFWFESLSFYVLFLFYYWYFYYWYYFFLLSDYYWLPLIFIIFYFYH